MISVGPSMSTRTASGATPGSAAMIQSCRSVSNTSTGGSQRAARAPGEGSKNWRWSASACLSMAQASAHIWFFGSRITRTSAS